MAALLVGGALGFLYAFDSLYMANMRGFYRIRDTDGDDIVGRGMNRDAIGARVSATVRGRLQNHWVRGGGGYLSVNDRRVHIGLGDATAADRIEITWPLGRKQLLESIAGDRFLTVAEPEK